MPPSEFEEPPEYNPTPLPQILFISPPFTPTSTPPSSASRARPTIQICITHLKLLSAFQALHTTITTSDPLFGISDSFGLSSLEQEREAELKKIREKRWDVYVTRAVERFERWWSISIPCSVGGRAVGRLRGREMHTKETFEMLPEMAKKLVFNGGLLPPLDVLMVWHAYMLHPREFLEDCIRLGKMDFWATGLPWEVIDSCLREDGTYNPSPEAREVFVSRTGYKWDNRLDGPTKELRCPKDQTKIHVPWTTCGFPVRDKSIDLETRLLGQGYGDREFRIVCPGCEMKITHEYLRVQKFKRDAHHLVLNKYPMPGTILSTDGLPVSYSLAAMNKQHTTFPNRLIETGLIQKIASIADINEEPRMKDIGECIEDAILGKTAVRKANNKRFSSKLHPEERMATKRMMTRYWENHSPFSVDLVEAVTSQYQAEISQTPFMNRMYEFDWLHHPDLELLMGHALLKYNRFIQLVKRGKGNVPTFEVDFIWHTDQLSPGDYYMYSVRVVGRLVVHSHRVRDWNIFEAFEETKREYEKAFGEEYTDFLAGSGMATAQEGEEDI